VNSHPEALFHPMLFNQGCQYSHRKTYFKYFICFAVRHSFFWRGDDFGMIFSLILFSISLQLPEDMQAEFVSIFFPYYFFMFWINHLRSKKNSKSNSITFHISSDFLNRNLEVQGKLLISKIDVKKSLVVNSVKVTFSIFLEFTCTIITKNFRCLLKS